jgi:hypothetical protein
MWSASLQAFKGRTKRSSLIRPPSWRAISASSGVPVASIRLSSYLWRPSRGATTSGPTHRRDVSPCRGIELRFDGSHRRSATSLGAHGINISKLREAREALAQASTQGVVGALTFVAEHVRWVLSFLPRQSLGTRLRRAGPASREQRFDCELRAFRRCSRGACGRLPM